MSNVLRVTKQTFTIAVAVATILWSVGASVLVAPLVAQAAVTPLADVPDGSLIKGVTHNAVYYYDGAERFVFPNQKTYATWFGNDFSSVKAISMADLGTVPLGDNVVYRPGTRLVKIDTMSNVYAVGDNGALHWVPDEVTAKRLYGNNWAQRVDDVPDAFFTNYSADPDNDLTSASLHPEGTLLSRSGNTYVVDGGKLRMVSDAMFASNKFRDEYVISLTADDFAAFGTGTEVGSTEFSSPAQAAVATEPSTPSDEPSTPSSQPAGTVGVSVASDNPATATILADSSAAADGAQMLVPMLKLRFTAGSQEVKVKTLKLTRTGVAADTDVDSLYLYDGWTRVADHNSFNKKIVTFTNSAGLFTVPANGTKELMLRMDLANSVGSSKTIGFQIAAAEDVELVGTGGSVSGSFPMSGNNMTTTQVSDLGTLTIGTFTSFPATIDPGVVDRELWRFTLTSGSQDLDVEYLRLTMVGTIDPAHLKNLRLEVGGTQLGDAVPQLASDKVAVFDWSNSPYMIPSGQSKVFILRGDVAGGAGRTFKWTFQRSADSRTRDRGYNAYIEMRQSAGTDFSLIEPQAGSGTAVNSGTLTIGLTSDTPSVNVPDGASNVTLAKNSFKAVGEDIKISQLNVSCTSSDTSLYLVNVKVLLDGTQVGTTDTSMNCNANGDSTAYTFGNTFIVKEGKDHVVSVVADTTASSSDNNDTVTVRFDTGSSNAQRQVTLGSFNTTLQAGKTLTIKSGTVAVAKNQSFGSRSSSNPTGVANGAGVRIASFTVTAGGGEPVDVTQFILQDVNGTTQVGDNFQNLKLKKADGTQIGNTVANADTSGTQATYSFAPSPALRVGKSDILVIDVFADIKSSPQDSGCVLDGGSSCTEAGTSGVVLLDDVTATGVDTGSDASVSNQNVVLQKGYIATQGNLNVVIDADTPVATQVVMGATGVNLAKFKYSADSSESLNLQTIAINFELSAAATPTLKNLKLINAQGQQVGSTLGSLTTQTSSSAYAKFDNLSLSVPASQSVVLTVQADLASYLEAGFTTTGQTLTVFHDPTDYDSVTASSQQSVTVIGAQSGNSLSANSVDFATSGDTDVDQNGNAMTFYRTKLGIAYASDTPSGSYSGSSEQDIAFLLVSNTQNAGSYDATVYLLNFTLGNVGISNSADRTAKVYKDSRTSANQVATTNWVLPGSSKAFSFSAPSNPGYENNGVTTGFTDTTVSAGFTRKFIVTLDTSDAGSTDRLSFSIAAGQITWGDGVTTSITTVNDLPLGAKTLSY